MVSLLPNPGFIVNRATVAIDDVARYARLQWALEALQWQPQPIGFIKIAQPLLYVLDQLVAFGDLILVQAMIGSVFHSIASVVEGARVGRAAKYYHRADLGRIALQRWQCCYRSPYVRLPKPA
ncbi:hypothetical protein D3C72_921050 [compost metagenome]